MKALRYLLIGAMISLTSVLSATNVVAQNLAQQPEAQMKSTSAMPSSGSTLPQAAIEGVTTTYSPSNPPSGPRRVGRDDDPGEPGYDEPLGDGIGLLVLLCILFVIMKRKHIFRKKSALTIVLALMSMSVFAEGYESMANITKQTYEWTDVTNYTGDNGKAWKAVGARDSKISGYNALAIHSSVNGNGLSGNLTAQQTAEGVGIVSFMVKGAEAGSGYGDRTFRVTAGTKSVTATVNVPSMTSSYQVEAKIDATGASTLAITMLESVSGETASFYIYNITWTSFSGKTDTPTFSCANQFVANGSDTTYYTEDMITVQLASTTEGATLYYTTDGSDPSTSSTQASSLTLGAGTHTVKAMAWTAAQGESEIATHIYHVAKGKIVQYDASDYRAGGEYNTITNGGLPYTTLSGQPFYQINNSKNHIITDAVVYPQGLSCYAKNTNSRKLTIAWQAGNVVLDGDEEVFEETGDWNDVVTLSEFDKNDMKRFEIPVPETVKDQVVRFRIKTSGTSVYVDDIITIGADVARAGVPILSHASGEVASGTEISITPATGTTIHYTVNSGTEQTSTGVAKLTLTESTALEVYATQEGKAKSLIVRAQYTVNGETPVIHPESVTLDKTEVSIVEGQTETLIATVMPVNAEDKSIIWSSDNEAAATVADGIITAVAPGFATITVTTTDGGLTATCAVTVTPYIAPEPIHPESITLNKTEVTLEEGAIASLKATVLPNNAENKSVTWSSDNEAVAIVSEGTVTAVAPGKANITATTVDGGLTATCIVTVTKAPVYVTGVTLNKTDLELKVGEGETLIATVEPADAENKQVFWESDNEAIVTVTDGYVLAHSEGNTVVRVVTADGSFTAQCYVYVTKYDPEGIDEAKDAIRVEKILREGQIFIIRGDPVYTITGMKVK